jgi:hypothetical protein
VELDYAILADGTQLRPDGKLDIYGAGFDTIFASAVPALHPRLVVALRFVAERGEQIEGQQIEVSIESPDGALVARAEGNIGAGVGVREPPRGVSPDEPVGIGAVLNFGNLLFQVHGRYQLFVRWGDQREHVMRFFVVTPPQDAP